MFHREPKAIEYPRRDASNLKDLHSEAHSDPPKRALPTMRPRLSSYEQPMHMPRSPMTNEHSSAFCAIEDFMQVLRFTIRDY